MLKSRTKRQAVQAEQAVAALSKIEASIATLDDDDLLDLADIFAGQPSSPLAVMAADVMTKRNLSL